MKCGCVGNNSQQRSMSYERFHNLPTLAELGVEIEEKYDGSENEVSKIFFFYVLFVYHYVIIEFLKCIRHDH